MTFDQLKASFELLTGAEGVVNAADLAIWLNEAQNDLALDFGPSTKKSYQSAERSSDGSYALPSDCLKPICLDDEARSAAVLNEEERLVAPDGAVLIYRRQPVAFSGVAGDQVSELHAALHDLLPLYAASRYWDGESEGDYQESALGLKWMNHYRQGKLLRAQTLAVFGPKAQAWQVI